MVNRDKLNKPICRAKGTPILWITEIGVQWICDCCRKPQKGNTITIQVGVKGKSKYHQIYNEALNSSLNMWEHNQKNTNPYVERNSNTISSSSSEDFRYKKVFICAKCAKELCNELLETITSIERTSIEAYKTMEGI